ncbi:hypothetical protein LOTGIDRAFT_134181 [Lottia gigantea]|uniref:Peptidase M28 domain-containing protein n=1 Tax=Lottia gigantea TaxID=225164 RepID=V3YXX8_LOTGI|nr:hypothetical protein LOTGIDRAFT_134181 [Lottia gigantea]ESO82943.1 hypothetical protein LOTGIDRAFT_134181 [Lottia gigantea]
MGNLVGLIKYVVDMWNTFHFDTVKRKNYFVQLSYPNYTETNQILVYDESNSTVFHSHSNASNVLIAYLPFNAYAKSGVVKGPLVYGHFGRTEDFQALDKLNVEVNGSIVLIRYGRIHPGNKVKHAEQAGAVGVILYCDPAEYTDGTDGVEGTWWLPSWGVQLSHVRYNLVGDPGTPDYTAVHSASYDKTVSDLYPSIPVYPIMYSDADKLMSLIDKTVPVPRHWNGKLKSKYYAGVKRGQTDYQHLVEMTVTNAPEKRNITNVIASLRGKIEPDRFVIVGSHIDSWTQGIVDSGTGFSILMDLARTFSDQVMAGWRPRRTIIFAFWDASKYGHIGSYEWVQEYEQQLSAGAVAYINLDSVIRGSYSFSADSSPLLYDVIYNAAMTVKCVDPDFQSTTVYEMWKNRFPSDVFHDRPKINGLAGDSDQSPFSYHVGVPSMSVSYTYDTNRYPNLPTYPVYSTLDDTLDYLETFIDTNFTRHIAVNQILADIVLQLADSALLPFNITNYIHIIHLGQASLLTYENEFRKAEINLASLNHEIDFFINSTREFQSSFNRTNSNEHQLHSRNEKLLRLTRAFVVPVGLPEQPQYRNILVAPHAENLNEETVFPGIVSGVIHGRKGNWNILKDQVAILTITFKRASSVLNDDIYTKV